MEERRRELWRRLLPWAAFGVVILLILYIFDVLYKFYILYKIKAAFLAVLFPVLFAVILAYMLNPLVTILSRALRVRGSRKTSRLIATSLVFVVLISLVTLLSIRIFPPLIEELEELSKDLPRYGRQVLGFINGLQKDYMKLKMPASLQSAVNTELEKLIKLLASKIRDMINSLTKTIFHLVNFILIPIIAFYLLYDSRSLKREFIFLVSPKRRRRVLRLIEETNRILNSYVIGTLIICLSLFFLMWLGLVLLPFGLRKFALILAAIVGVSRAIPIYGQVIGLITVGAFGLAVSWGDAVLAELFLIGLYAFEGKIVFPILMGHEVRLHPVIIIFAILIGWVIFGAVGMFIATPIAAIIRMIVRFYTIEPRTKTRLRQAGSRGLLG